MNKVKDRLKSLRKKMGLTQQVFAEKLKVPRNTIGGYEAGKSNPSDGAINNICKTFNVNEDWLRTGQGEMFIKTPDNTLEKLKQEYDLDSFSYNLICEYLKLDSKKRDAVRDYFHNVLSYEEISETAATIQDTRSLTREQLHAALDRELELEEKTATKSEVLRKSG